MKDGRSANEEDEDAKRSKCSQNQLLPFSLFCLPAIFLSPYFICLAVYLYSVPLWQRQLSPCPPSTANLQAYKAPVASVSPFSSRAHTGKCYNSLRSLRRKAFETKPSRHFHGTLSLCLKSIPPPPRFSFFLFPFSKSRRCTAKALLSQRRITRRLRMSLRRGFRMHCRGSGNCDVNQFQFKSWCRGNGGIQICWAVNGKMIFWQLKERQNCMF